MNGRTSSAIRNLALQVSIGGSMVDYKEREWIKDPVKLTTNCTRYRIKHIKALYKNPARDGGHMRRVVNDIKLVRRGCKKPRPA